MTKPNTKSIVEALSKFQQEANVAVKDKKNPYFKSSYAGLEDVIAAANQGAKFGLAFTQTIDYQKQIIEGVIDTTMYVTTSLMHTDSDAVIKSRYLIIPKNNKYDDSQALGSAITYAKRYSLQAIYGLPSEDDDGNAAVSSKPTAEDNKWIKYSKEQVEKMNTISKDANLSPEERLNKIEDQENSQKNNWDNCKEQLPAAGDQISIRCSYIKSKLNEIIKKKKEVNNGDSNAN
jgi:hypothetical protein